MRRRSKLSDPMDLVYGNKSNDIQGQDNSLDYLSKTNPLQGFQSADSYKQNIGYQRHMPEYKRRSSQRVGNVFWENGKKILVIVGGVLIFLVVTAFLTTYGPGILGALTLLQGSDNDQQSSENMQNRSEQFSDAGWSSRS